MQTAHMICQMVMNNLGFNFSLYVRFIFKLKLEMKQITFIKTYFFCLQKILSAHSLQKKDNKNMQYR